MKKAVLLTSCAVMVGCSWVPDVGGLVGLGEEERESYIDTRPLPPMQIPEGLNGDSIQDALPVPKIAEQRNPSFYPARPPLPNALYASDNRNEVRVQRLSSRNWLVIPEPPTSAWPKIKQFFADNGVSLSSDRPSVGRLTTQWLSNDGEAVRDVVRRVTREAKSQAGMAQGADRFLIRVEQGLQPQSTEVHLRHDNDVLGDEADASMVTIQAMDSDLAAAETALLQQIGEYIAARVAETTVSQVALQIGSLPKTGLLRNPEGLPELTLYLDEDRAWATLTQAMQNADILVNEQNREEGQLSISIPQSVFTGKEGGGILCRVTFSCGGSDLEVILRTEGPIQEPSGDAFKVTVWQADGPLQDFDRAQEILVLIREYAT